jgi:DNA cross-link repair 1C protein
MRLYHSLYNDLNREDRLFGSYLAPEAPILTGYRVGNTDHPGILTLNHTVRLHSCEKGIRCSHLGDQTVWIKPIIAHTSSGQDICEIGIGGGGGDLNQQLEVELDSDTMIMQLMEL